MAKVVVANRLIRGGKTYRAGDVIDVPAGEAADLLYKGKARPHVEQPVKPVEKGAKNG